MRISFYLALIFIYLPSVCKAGANPNVTKLKCEFVDQLCYLRGSFNKLSNLELILDTGSSQSVIDIQKAKELHLAPVGTGAAAGPGNGQDNTYQVFSGIQIGIGNTFLENQTIIALPFGYVGAQDGFRADGTLGANVFKNYTVEIDYDSGLVSLDSSTANLPTQNTVPFTFSDQVPVVTAQIHLPAGEVINGKFLIDTGLAGPGIVILESFYKKHPELLNGLDPQHPRSVDVVGGKMFYVIGTLPMLTIGSNQLKSLKAIYPINAAGVYSRIDIDGSFGPGVLSHFRVEFDYRHSRMALFPVQH